MEALTSRSDAQLAELAILRHWNFSQEEEQEIKNAALALVRHPTSGKARARGVALCVAMKAQDIKLKHNAEQANKPTVPTFLVQNNTHVSVSPDALLATLGRIQKRPTVEVLENTPPLVERSSTNAPDAPPKAQSAL